MLGFGVRLLAVLAAAANAAKIVTQAPSGPPAVIRWCVIGVKNEEICRKMAQDLQKALLLQVICVRGKHLFDCMKLIHDGAADAINLDPEQLFVGGKYFDMKPLINERVNDSDVAVDAVVVVKKSLQYTDGLNDLRGKRLCLAGADESNIQYQALVNVLFPLDFIRVNSDDQCSSTIPSLAEHFGPSCMPGRWSSSAQLRKLYGKQLCALCRTVCTEQDFYAGPDGAVRCLLNNDADVAITSTKALMEANLDSERYHLLCIQGARRPLAKPCAWMASKRNVVAISTKAAEKTQARWKKALMLGYDRFHNVSEARPWLYKLIFSRSDLSGVSDVYYHETYERYLGLVFARTFSSPLPPLQCGQPKPWRWCLVQPSHVRKCEQMAYAFAVRRLKPALQCISARSTDECVHWLAEGGADFAVLSPRDAVVAHERHGLTPIVAERYSDHTDATGYMLAVVKRATNFTIENLQGAGSCHSSADDVLGWNAPLTILERRHQLSIIDCDYARSAGGFFWESCVPEIASHMKHSTDDPHSLCALCGGSRPEDCGEKSTFKGPLGALKCLTQPRNAGDVAFVTNETLAALNQDAPFELLCLNGGRRSLSDYRNCHWLKLPARVGVVNSHTYDADERRKLTQLLLDAQLHYGALAGDDVFSIFSTENDPTTVFSESTVELTPLWPEQSLDQIFGADYTAIYRQTIQCSGCNSLGQGIFLVAVFVHLYLQMFANYNQ